LTLRRTYMKKHKNPKPADRNKTAKASRPPKEKVQARVLVVDDEADFALMIQKTLEGEGYYVDTALNGTQAIELHRKHAYDLALVDLKMPDMTGLELLQYLKVRDKRIAVILMTAFGSLAVGIEALKKGASDYLPKPFKLAALLEKAEEALKRRARYLEEQAHSPIDEM
jgi:DNA-binding NtrC family response regulator